jgi:tol-pal system-associated acyl-CoA thioesterase
MAKHNIEFRVYYEDTDAGGVVYHANFLRFTERARTEVLREMGFNQSHLKEKEKVLFVVRHMDIDFKRPGRLDDVLRVETSIAKLSASSMTMEQNIFVEDAAIAHTTVVVVCIDLGFKPTRIPDSIRSKLEAACEAA